MRIFAFILVFLLLGAFFIISNNDLHLSEKSELDEFARLYYSWLGDIFSNAKSLTGYITKAEWMPSHD